METILALGFGFAVGVPAVAVRNALIHGFVSHDADSVLTSAEEHISDAGDNRSSAGASL